MLFSSVDAVVAHLQIPRDAGRRVIGIAGEPGAGKSTIAAQLAERLGATLLPMDGYHLPQSELRRLGRRERMGAPDTFDINSFVHTLGEVRLADHRVLAPAFNRDIEEAVADAITIESTTTIVVVEGNYLLLETDGWERVAALLDESFFVAVDHEIRLQRLVDRHVHHGKTHDEALAWALGPDESNARLIAATALRADHVIRLD